MHCMRIYKKSHGYNYRGQVLPVLLLLCLLMSAGCGEPVPAGGTTPYGDTLPYADTYPDDTQIQAEEMPEETATEQAKDDVSSYEEADAYEAASYETEPFDDEEIVAPEEIVAEVPDIWNDEDLIYENGVWFHKDVTESKKALFMRYYYMEPDEIRRALDAYDVIIVVGPDGTYSDGNAGIYYSEERILAVNAETEGKIKMSVNHEIGHCVDAMIGELAHMPVDEQKYWIGISNIDTFQRIFDEEVKDAGYPEWNSIDTFEFFAETYRYVIEDNEYMMDRAPKASAFVKDVLAHYYKIEK